MLMCRRSGNSQFRADAGAPSLPAREVSRTIRRSGVTLGRAATYAGILLLSWAVPQPGFAQQAGFAVKAPPIPFTSLNLPAPTLAENHLLGDFGGLTPALADYGVSFNLNFITETASNVSGGKSAGTDYSHQFILNGNIDFGKAAGIDGLSLHSVTVSRAGRNVNELTGDTLIQAQDDFGFDNVAAHFAFVFLEYKTLDGHLDLTAGRMPIQIDFDNSDLYCDFMSGTVCGDPRAISAMPGVVPFPANTWGGRARYDINDKFYLMAGVYQNSPTDGGDTGLDWRSAGASGVTIPVEFGYTPSFGPDQLAGHYKVGFIQNTAKLSDNFADTLGGPAVLSGLPARQDSGATAVYFLADQMIHRNGPGLYNGLVLLGGYAHTTPEVSQFQDYLFGGLVDRGVLPGRPDDKLGFLVTYAHVSSALTAAQQVESNFGLPFSGGATGIQTNETVFELNYNIAAAKGISIQPDIQYLVRPGATSTYPNSLILGLKTNVTF